MATVKRVYRIPKKSTTAEKQKRELAARKKVLKKKYPRGMARGLRERTNVRIITIEMRRIVDDQKNSHRSLLLYLDKRSPARMTAVYGLQVTRANNTRDQFIAKCARIIEGGRILKSSPATISGLITIEFNKLTEPPTTRFQSAEQGNT